MTTKGVLTPIEIINKIDEYDNDSYRIDKSRPKNINTIFEYNLRDDFVIKTIKELSVNDYVKYIKCNNKKYNTDYLYVFDKDIKISNNKYSISIYIKIGFNKDKVHVEVVSFHENI